MRDEDADKQAEGERREYLGFVRIYGHRGGPIELKSKSGMVIASDEHYRTMGVKDEDKRGEYGRVN